MLHQQAAKGSRDVTRVRVDTPDEVQYWTTRFNVSPEHLKAAVSSVGYSVDAIASYLNSDRSEP